MVTIEVGKQKKLASKTGLSLTELKTAQPTPTALAYSSLMIRVASTGSFGEIAAVMAQCPLSYVEIAERLTLNKGLEREPVRKEWCAFYASSQSKELTKELKRPINGVEEKANSEELEKMKTTS